MTDQPFSPFSPSMIDELRRQYNDRTAQYELLEKSLRAELMTKENYDLRKSDLDETIRKLEKIDREFHILG